MVAVDDTATVTIPGCEGCGRLPPLRWTLEGLRMVREALGEDPIDDDAVLVTYRCRHCKTMNGLTAADLYLSESGMSAEPA